MRKRKVLMLLVTLSLVFAMACSLQNKAKELKTGKYVMQDTELEDWAWVILKKDNQFQFNRSSALSYMPSGTYSIEDNILILSVSENEVYRFMIDGDKLIFESGDMAEDFIKEGAIFKLSEKE